jgi:hypothetical protein
LLLDVAFKGRYYMAKSWIKQHLFSEFDFGSAVVAQSRHDKALNP